MIENSLGTQDSVRELSLVANDIVYNPADDKIYASLPSSVGPNGNSIQRIDPHALTVSPPTYIGSEPTRLAMANDGITLYAALSGSYSIRRFDTGTQTAGLQFSMGYDNHLGHFRPHDIAVSPENPNTIVASRFRDSVTSYTGIAVYDNGIQLQNTGPNVNASGTVVFGQNTSTLYGVGMTNSGLTTYNMTPSGVSVVSSSTLAASTKIKFDGQYVFTSSGQVIDPSTSSVVGNFPNVNTPAFVPQTSVGRAYFLVNDPFVSGRYILRAFDTNTFAEVGNLVIPVISGTAKNADSLGRKWFSFRYDRRTDVCHSD